MGFEVNFKYMRVRNKWKRDQQMRIVWLQRPGVLWFMGSQWVGHDWETELNWTESSQRELKPSMEKAMAPHSSTLAWKIPWMEEPGRLQSMGSLRVGHDWATSLSLFYFHALEKEMATYSSVLAWRIPGAGEPGGLTSMWSHRLGNDWSDLAVAA